MAAPIDVSIPALAAVRREMALAATPSERLASITLGLGKLIAQIRAGTVDKAIVVDAILESAWSTGLVDDIGLEQVEQTIAAALEPLARVNGGGGWDPTSAWEDNSNALALTYFAELSEHPSAKPWVIKNVIARDETSSWFAPPGRGKSALLTDIAVHKASGIDWRGYRTKGRKTTGRNSRVRHPVKRDVVEHRRSPAECPLIVRPAMAEVTAAAGWP